MKVAESRREIDSTLDTSFQRGFCSIETMSCCCTVCIATLLVLLPRSTPHTHSSARLASEGPAYREEKKMKIKKVVCIKMEDCVKEEPKC